ncbi:MAG: glycosyltransferase family 4 protein [Candidatus Diapherotrites archaeon]|nr:glycosyltransferase family 4 protein [Candidatus Diapherotrites archaeon]
MKILYINDTSYPGINAGAIRAYYFCRYLSEWGNDITLITDRENKEFPWKTIKFSGKSIPQIFPGFGFVPSILNQTLKETKKQKFDLVFGSMPLFSSGLTAYIVHKIARIPLVIDVRDPFIRSMFQEEKTAGYIYQKSLKGRILKPLEAKIFGAAKEIIVTNPGIKKELMTVHKIHEKKIRVIYNGFDEKGWEKIEPKKFVKKTLLAAGRITTAKSFDVVIGALKVLGDDWQFVMCGDGDAGIQKFLDAAKKEGVSEKVIFAGKLAQQEAISYTKGADILVASNQLNDSLKYAIPGRTFEYIAAGKPILAIWPKGGDFDEFLTKFDCGRIVGRDLEEVKKTILFLYENRKELGENARKASKNFTREDQAKQLMHVFGEVVS